MGELKGTGVHVAKPLLLWERGQTEEKETPLSLSLFFSLSRAHIHIHSNFSLILSLSLVLSPHLLLPCSLSTREPSWLENQMTN